jgi:hypothetical protein
MENPRTIGRLLVSLKEGGVTAMTGELQSNTELLRDPKTVYQRLGRNKTCQEMILAHEQFAVGLPGRLEKIDDAVAADAVWYNRWVEALIRSRQVIASGEWYRISPMRMIPITLRVLGGWLH